MSLSDAFFVSPTLHERKVALPDGSEHVLHFRELPASEFRRFSLYDQSEDEELKVAAQAKLIAASLCEPDGKPAITAEKAAALTPPASRVIVEAIMSVNRFTGKKASPSADPSGSATS